MKRSFFLACLVLLGLTAFVQAEQGNPKIKTIEAIAFGPDGLLLIGGGAQVVTVETGDTKEIAWSKTEIAGIDQLLAGKLGMTAKDLHNYYVRSDTGQMVPLDNLATVTESSGPPVITHYNLFRAVEIDGSAAPGYSSGQGLTAMEDLAKQSMMPGMKFEWTGLTLDELESGGKALIIFGLGILVVYLTLSAQYESFALPFIILLAVPMAVLGALGLVWARGLANDVYCQIGLVMLIGLSAKNSILIVEFAEQLRRKGRSIADAAAEAGGLRLRPILMTSFAFILGILPLVFATGAGAQGRRSVGTTIVGGMLLSTILNLFFIPVLYVILSRLLKRGDAPTTYEPPAPEPAEAV